ncbi:MAG: hypothetical protein AAF517_08550 [Planctomycetota bacterium]
MTNPRATLLLTLVILASLLSGCSLSREIRLWPLIDLDRSPPNHDGTDTAGIDLDLVWPFFGLNTQGPIRSHLWPVYGVDTGSGDGWFASWLIHYSTGTRKSFTAFPFYWWGQVGETSWHYLIPIAGQTRTPHESTTFVVPYVAHENREYSVKGLLVPPILMGKAAERDEGWLWAINTLRFWEPDASSTYFFPFASWGGEDSEDRQGSWFWVFPSFYHEERVRDGREESETAFWPLLSRVDTRDDQGLEFGLVPTWTFDGPRLRKVLGWRERSDSRGAARGFESFPLYAQREVFSDREALESGGDPIGEEWRVPLVGFATWSGVRWKNGVSAESDGWALWPWYSRSTSEGTIDGDAQRAVHTRALAGLIRTDHDPDTSSRWSVLYPFQEAERHSSGHSHRLWPLYRYRSEGGQRSLVTVGELLGVRRGDDIDESPLFFLHPISYQSTPGGDYDFRLLWKWIESRKKGPKTKWALHPLVYRRDEPDQERSLLLGGLIGLGRDRDREFLRLLWLFDVDI